MKKILKVFLLSLCLVISACGKEASIDEARTILAQHLEKRYGEEFEIGFGGRRSFKIGDREKSWYEFSIKPKSYIGTPKEYDSYYKSIGEVEIKKSLFSEILELSGDNYNLVLFKECANEFYGKKLKELFGENILPVLEISGEYSEKTKDFLESVKKTKDLDQNLYIKGGIYIFGRVESDEDREWYRAQIFKFLTFMKETGTFEYVDLAFYILDERILTKKFEKAKPLLIEKIKECNSSQEFIEYREKILSQLDNEYKKMTVEEKQEKINNYSKSQIREFKNYDYTGYCSIYHTALRSIKFLENEPRLSMYKKLDYNSKKDIKLYNTIKIIFKEYDEKKLYTNEWGD